MPIPSERSLPGDLQAIGSESWASSIIAPDGTVRWSESDKLMLVTVRSTGDRNELDLSGAPIRILVLEVVGNAYMSNLRNIPNLWSVTLPEGPVFVSIQVAKGTQAAVSLLGSPLSQVIDVISSDRRNGQLVLRDTSIDKLYVRDARVELEAMPFDAPTSHSVVNYVHVESGEVSIKSRTVSDLLTAARCSVTLDRTKLGVLLPLKTSVLTFKMNHSSIRSVRRSPHKRVLSDASESDLILESGSNLVVENVSDLNLVVRQGSQIECSSIAQNITVTGPGVVHLLQGAQSVQFRRPAATLNVKDHSQAVDISGPLKLGDVAGASIIGVDSTRRSYKRDRGLLIEGFSNNARALEGVSLVNVAFPVSLAGLRTIAVVQDAAFHVSPSLHDDLPGLGPLAGPRVSAHRRPTDTSSKFQIDAQYARALSELAREKGAPGSARTLLAWCSYRMRNLVAPGRWERGVLRAYRIIGYGERVGPPVLAFSVLVVVFNIWALRHNALLWNCDGFKVWLQGLLDWATTPLHILKLTGDDRPKDFQFTQPWDTLARFVVAVPFATAALALRNYVKAE